MSQQANDGTEASKKRVVRSHENSTLHDGFDAFTLASMSTETLDKPLTYEEERGKPMPSSNHGAIQANLIVEFARQRDFRVYSELTLERV